MTVFSNDVETEVDLSQLFDAIVICPAAREGGPYEAISDFSAVRFGECCSSYNTSN
jgi:hypothetical protein